MRPALPTLLLLLLLVLTPAAAPGQSYSLYGDLRGGVLYDHLPASGQAQQLSALASVQAQHRLSFELLEFSALHSLTWLGGAYAGLLQASLPAELQSLAGGSLPIHRIDEAFAELYLGRSAAITVGKQRMSWGTARSFTPTDVIHPDGPLPTATEGFTGISGNATIGAGILLAAGVSLDQALAAAAASAADGASADPFWQDLRYAARGSLLLFRNLELAPSVVYQRDRSLRPGLGASVSAGPVLFFAEGAGEFHNPYYYPVVDPALLEDASADSELWRQGVLAATSLEQAVGRAADGPGDPRPVATAGLEWSPRVGPVTATLTAEYLYNGLGYSAAEREDLYRLIRALRPDVPVPPPTGISALLGGAGFGPGSGLTAGAGSSGAGTAGDGTGDPGVDGASEAVAALAAAPPTGSVAGTAHPLGLPPLLGRHYAIPTLSLEIAGYVTVSSRGLVNLADGSVLGQHGVTITPASSFDIDLVASWAAGRAYESELGTFPGEQVPPGRIAAGAFVTIHF